jgi:hypothetical protein
MRNQYYISKGEITMTFFSKKKHYVIVADETTNFIAQRFADKHHDLGQGVYTVDGVRYGVYMISFVSSKGQKRMHELIKETFDEYCKVEIDKTDGNLIYISKRD